MSVESRGVALAAPFPFFGGKSRAASLIWERLGDVQVYVEPFAGSLAVLLGRPHEPRTETVNDINGMISNFWRSVSQDPDLVAQFADWPVNEADVNGRHVWLLGQLPDLTDRLMGDPHFYDPKVAGWWVHGICAWIGSGYCSGNGPWVSENGKLVKRSNQSGAKRQIPYINTGGLGVHGSGVTKSAPYLYTGGRGIHMAGVSRQIPNIGNMGKGIHSPESWLEKVAALDIYSWFRALQARLRCVRVCCGDWSRVVGPSATWKIGLTGLVLDPPYEDFEGVYGPDANQIAREVRKYAIENGDNPLMRIALCGYDDLDMPDGWTRAIWTAHGGYGLQRKSGTNDNRNRETIWFNAACLKPENELPLFAAMNGESPV